MLEDINNLNRKIKTPDYEKDLLCFLILLFASRLYAQAPNFLNYQGVARDASGIVLPNQNISLRFTVHQATGGGTIVYEETQSVTTNLLGLFTVAIGSGTLVSGNFATIAWGSNNEYLQVEMDPSGGSSYLNMGTSQFLSVPYALNAGSSTGTAGGDLTGNYPNPTLANIQGVGVSASTPSNGQVLGYNGTNWAPTATVTTFSAGNLSPLFTTSVANAASTPALSFSLSNANAYTVLGNNTNASAAPVYFTPTLASALFANQGTTTTVLHGNALGNPSWGQVNQATDVTGVLGYANGGTGLSTVGGAGTVLTISSGAPAWVAPVTSATAWQLTGNTVTGSTNTLGTANGFPLKLEINGAYAGSIDPQSGSANTYIGAAAPSNGYGGAGNNDGGGYSVGIGLSALSLVTGGGYDVAVGNFALDVATTPTGSTAIGGLSQRYTTSSAGYNTTVGFESAYTNTVGRSITAVGASALLDNTASANVAVGDSALATNTSALQNTAVGYQSLAQSTSPYNTAVGYQSLYGETSGAGYNTAVGGLALMSAAGGNQNVAVGYQALKANTANANTAIGTDALIANATGVGNAAGGYAAAFGQGGSNNTAFGYDALLGAAGTGSGAITGTGGGNTAIGSGALQLNNSGINNTALGYAATVSTDGLTNATAIGANATVSASNTVVLGNNANVQFSLALMPGGQTGTSGQLLQSNGASFAPSWINPTVTAGAAGGVNYGTGSGSAFTAPGFSGQVLQSNGSGGPSWVNISALGATGGDNWGSQTAMNDSVATNGVTNTINGNGTGSHPLTIAQQGATTGQVLSWNGSKWVPAPTAVSGWGLLGNASITNPAAPANYGVSTFGSSENWVGTTDSKDLTFGTDKIERMRISGGTVGTAGYVGIGKSAPTQPLDVAGNVQFSKALMPNSAAGTGGNILLSAGANTAPTWLANGSTVGYVLTTTTANAAPTWAAPAAAGWALTGNAVAYTASAAPANYVGTTSASQGVQFGVAGVNAGRIESNSLSSGGNLNTAVGYQAMNAGASGSRNTAVGCLALTAVTGIQNTAVGSHALIGCTGGNYNTAMGLNPAIAITTGQYNVAIGWDALTSAATTSSYNTAVGGGALASAGGTAFSNASAFGYEALQNSVASNNTAVGYFSQNTNSSGTPNTSIGYESLLSNSTGADNVAVGYFALKATTAGQNTAVGDNALLTNTTGTANTAIGYNANVGSVALTNATAIGANATVSASNSIVLGSSANVGIGTGSPNSTLQVVGGVSYPIVTTALNLTLTNAHHTVVITGGTPTISLPAAAGNTGRMYVLVNETASPAVVSTYQDFTGSANTAIPANSSIIIQTDGTNWYQIR